MGGGTGVGWNEECRWIFGLGKTDRFCADEPGFSSKMSEHSNSIIFVTLEGGPYKDRWNSELFPLLKTEECAGYRELIWEGQGSGLRDQYVGRGTLVAVRPSKKTRYFDIVGTVSDIIRTRAWSNNAPAEYKLSIKVMRQTRRIHKLSEDRFTHNSVLRELGFPLEMGAMPHGIYTK